MGSTLGEISERIFHMGRITQITISDYNILDTDTITSMYKDIAKNFMKVSMDEDFVFNPKYIYVAENIYSKFARAYENRGADKMAFVMLWLGSGPKVDESLEDNQIRVEDGFIDRNVDK